MTLNINHSEDNVANVEFPRNFLSKVHVGRCAYDSRGLCSSPGAQFADFNIWSRAMTEVQMKVCYRSILEEELIVITSLKDWTTCNKLSSGNLVSWETAKWKLENMVEEIVTQDDLCKPLRPGHVLFPERRNMTSGIDLCMKMKANVSVVDSARTLNELVNIYSNILVLNEGVRCKFQSNIDVLLQIKTNTLLYSFSKFLEWLVG